MNVSRKHTEAAVKAVTDRYIQAGTMSPLAVDIVSNAAIPIAAASIKGLRAKGWSVMEVTSYLEGKVAAAEIPARKLAAEIFLAAWEGMQADFAEAFGHAMEA